MKKIETKYFVPLRKSFLVQFVIHLNKKRLSLATSRQGSLMPNLFYDMLIAYPKENFLCDQIENNNQIPYLN